MSEFVPFPKIARLDSTCTVTEKIDGTNACVIVTADGEVLAQSRSRIITPTDDNYGFARWVKENRRFLVSAKATTSASGGGRASSASTAKSASVSRCSTCRWADGCGRPFCCDVVPTLLVGEFRSIDFARVEHDLRAGGSVAAPGFMKPEGFVVYHHRLNAYLKHPFDKPAERPVPS